METQEVLNGVLWDAFHDELEKLAAQPKHEGWLKEQWNSATGQRGTYKYPGGGKQYKAMTAQESPQGILKVQSGGKIKNLKPREPLTALPKTQGE